MIAIDEVATAVNKIHDDSLAYNISCLFISVAGAKGYVRPGVKQVGVVSSVKLLLGDGRREEEGEGGSSTVAREHVVPRLEGVVVMQCQPHIPFTMRVFE